MPTQKINVFTSASGDGQKSTPVQLAYTEVEGEQDNPKMVVFAGRSASWNGATISPEICLDLNASPQQWDVLQVSSGADMVDVVITGTASQADSFTIPILLNPGEGARLSITDTGSPLTVINAEAQGPIVSAA